MTAKILWVVNYNNVSQFLTKAIDVGATAVAIRSDNDVAKAIPLFHGKGMQVYAWRWPSAQQDPAMHEADKAVQLFQSGLDGYIVDPEGKPGAPYNWDQKNLEKLADMFCKRITAAASGKLFGVTSHYRAAAVFPALPWGVFVQYATMLLPQAYWRSTEGWIGHGDPADNYKVSIDQWAKLGADPSKIIPMAGELGVSTGSQIAEYAAAVIANKRAASHFYAYDGTVKSDVWAAVKAA